MTVESVCPEELEPGDEFLFNDRTVPCVVQWTAEMDEWDGSIKVEYIVVADGPAGGKLWLQRTSTGRIRIKESVPWGPYANVRSLKRVTNERRSNHCRQ